MTCLQVLMRKSCEDPAENLQEVLALRSCECHVFEVLAMKIRKMPCLFWGACMKAVLGCSWEVLASRSCKASSAFSSMAIL